MLPVGDVNNSDSVEFIVIMSLYSVGVTDPLKTWVRLESLVFGSCFQYPASINVKIIRLNAWQEKMIREVKIPRFRCTGTSSVILFYWCLYFDHTFSVFLQ
jgi:hypothetical protein